VILGRPTNLWLGAITALLNALAVLANVPDSAFGAFKPYATAEVIAVINLALGAFIALIAVQPPVLNEGDHIHVTTPTGTPNAVASVGLEPSATPGGSATVTVSSLDG